MIGQFRVTVDGQVIVSHIKGQWSEETALRFEDELHKVVKRLSTPTFAHLLYFDEWELNTPGALPIIERMIAWCISQGMCASAEIFKPDVLKEYLLNKVQEEIKDNVLIRRFDNASDAKYWLSEQGFVSKHAALKLIET